MKNILLIGMFLFSIVAQAEQSQLNVKIDGMTCPSCATSVETHLKKLDSVASVSISIGKASATVTLKDGEALDKTAIKLAVKDAGFKVTKITIHE